MAVLFAAAILKLKVPIVGGSQDKAEKIMEYIVAHVGDHPDLYKGLINIKASEIEKLKVTVSKESLRWHDGGWIFVTSIDSRNVSKEGEGVVGEGGDIVVLEEAGLIKREEQFSKVVRMTETDNGWGKLVQTGNCVEGSVFETASKSPLYFKVRIGLEQAIEEGRYTREDLASKKLQTTSKDWKRYYLVMFPDHNEFTFFKPQKWDTLPPIKRMKFYGANDPALGKKKKNEADRQGSLVGIVVLGVDMESGQIYEVESIGEHLRPNEIINKIFSLPYEFERFGIEAIQFQSYFVDTIEEKSKAEGRYIPFMEIQQKRKKEERIESMEPFVNTGQILFREGSVLWNHMSEYPDIEYLDVLDTLEMCFRPLRKGSFDFDFI